MVITEAYGYQPTDADLLEMRAAFNQFEREDLEKEFTQLINHKFFGDEYGNKKSNTKKG
jgi:hypothetical protein